MKSVIQALCSVFGYRIIKANQSDALIAADTAFMDIYESCKAYTMTSQARCYALYKAVHYCVAANVSGDFVECGVWRGGNAMLIAKTLHALNVTDRTIYLYDTFAGMSEPTEHDAKVGSAASDTRRSWHQQQRTDHNTWCYADLEEVQANMATTHYPETQVQYVVGKVEDTLLHTTPEKIALLRLDTDWYESTKVELEILYPTLATKGVLLIDDYGSWAGARKAVDEYFATKPILLNKIDNTGHIGVKA